MYTLCNFCLQPLNEKGWIKAGTFYFHNYEGKRCYDEHKLEGLAAKLERRRKQTEEMLKKVRGEV